MSALRVNEKEELKNQNGQSRAQLATEGAVQPPSYGDRVPVCHAGVNLTETQVEDLPISRPLIRNADPPFLTAYLLS